MSSRSGKELMAHSKEYVAAVASRKAPPKSKIPSLSSSEQAFQRTRMAPAISHEREELAGPLPRKLYKERVHGRRTMTLGRSR